MKTRQRWAPEKSRWLAEHWPKMGNDACTAAFNAHFGTTFSTKSLGHRAGKIKACWAVPVGYYSVAEVVALTGISRSTLHDMIQRGNIEAERLGHRWMFSEATFAELQQQRVLPWPAMSSDAAADLLGYATSSGLLRAVSCGHIDAIKIGRSYFLRTEHVEWGLNFLRRTGCVNVPWYKLRERLGEAAA